MLLEDTGALLGLLFAMIGVGLTILTGNPVRDGVGTLLIGPPPSTPLSQPCAPRCRLPASSTSNPTLTGRWPGSLSAPFYPAFGAGTHSVLGQRLAAGTAAVAPAAG